MDTDDLNERGLSFTEQASTRPDFSRLGAYMKSLRERTRLEPREVWPDDSETPQLRRYPVRAENAGSDASHMTMPAACCFLGIGLYTWRDGTPRIITVVLRQMEEGIQRPLPQLLARARAVYCMNDGEVLEMMRLYALSLPPVPYLCIEDTTPARTRNRILAPKVRR